MIWRKRRVQEQEEIVLIKKDFDEVLTFLGWIESGLLPRGVQKQRALKLSKQLKESVNKYG